MGKVSVNPPKTPVTKGSSGIAAATVPNVCKMPGGGIVSSNTHGPTKFVGPGSMDVKIEGKNVHLLGDPMLNNCGPSGGPPNSATLVGVVQMCGTVVAIVGGESCPICEETHKKPVAESPKTKSQSNKLKKAADDAVAMAKKAEEEPYKRREQNSTEAYNKQRSAARRSEGGDKPE